MSTTTHTPITATTSTMPTPLRPARPPLRMTWTVRGDRHGAGTLVARWVGGESATARRPAAA